MGPRLADLLTFQPQSTGSAWRRLLLLSSKSEGPESAANLGGMLVTAAYMCLNFASSVAIIWCNKLAYEAGFEWPISLTAIHFVFTFVGLFISCRCGLFSFKAIKVAQVLPISAAFCGFVVFNNLSLQLNSVGVYQLLKVMTTPCIVVLEFVLYSQSLPLFQLLALIPICLGVSLATGSSADANLWGLTVGVFGIISTSLYQIWVKRKQDSLQCTSAQLLSYQAPLSALMLLAVFPFFEPLWTTTTTASMPATYLPGHAGPSGSSGDAISNVFLSRSDVLATAAGQVGNSSDALWGGGANTLRELPSLKGLFDFQWDSLAAFWVVASAFLSFLVNLSIFLVIKRTSALSYNVLGHAKLCTILISGYLFFDKQAPSVANVAGVLLTVFGVMAYTHLKLTQPKLKSPQKQVRPDTCKKADIASVLPLIAAPGGKLGCSSVSRKPDC